MRHARLARHAYGRTFEIRLNGTWSRWGHFCEECIRETTGAVLGPIAMGMLETAQPSREVPLGEVAVSLGGRFRK